MCSADKSPRAGKSIKGTGESSTSANAGIVPVSLGRAGVGSSSISRGRDGLSWGQWVRKRWAKQGIIPGEWGGGRGKKRLLPRVSPGSAQLCSPRLSSCAGRAERAQNPPWGCGCCPGVPGEGRNGLERSKNATGARWEGVAAPEFSGEEQEKGLPRRKGHLQQHVGEVTR